MVRPKQRESTRLRTQRIATELPGGGSGARMHEVRSAAVGGTADNGDITCDTGTGGGLC